MNDTQTLEVQLKSTAQEAKQNIDELVKNLTNIEGVLTNIYLSLGKLESKSGKTISNATNEVDKLSNVSKIASNNASKIGRAFSLGAAYIGVKRLTGQFLDWMNYSVDFTEQLNLFNVVFKNIEKNGTTAFSEVGKEATKFQYKLNEAFGTNKTETLKYQGLFQSMGENVGIDAKHAAIMSETMTKLTYDLASLYNKSETNTAEALRAGVYAGQTKPLRSFGIDVTQTSMQPILDELGIDRAVKELSQAEKEILRYMTTLRQGSIAMGDFANTVESPANQLKVFKQQLVEAKAALTNLFIGAFARILPYANALLMVIKEVAKAIASFFGIKVKDYNTGIASMGDLSDGVSSVGDSAGKSAKKVKELKREVLSFDQIHNINENNDNSSGSGGSGGGVSGGIDQRLLDAIKGYDNGMEQVRMKATQIRDRIMEWLGFTKHINSETGEVYFSLDNTNSTMYKLVDALKRIVKYGKEAIKGVLEIIKKDFDNGSFGNILVGVFNTIAGLLEFIAKHKNAQKIIAKLVEAFLLFKVVTAVLKPFINMWKTFVARIQLGAGYVKNFAKQLKGTNNYILDANGNMKQYNKTIEGHSNVVLNADKSVNKWETAMQKAKTALGGIVTAAVGLITVHDALKSIADEGPNVSNVLEGIVGSLSTIGGFATIGSIFGPVGTAIGAAAGAVVTLVTALSSYNSISSKIVETSKKELDVAKEKLKSYASQKKAIEDTMNANLSLHGYNQTLISELGGMVDANGKLKDGYEERAKFILTTLNDAYGTEYTLLDLQQGKYGEIKKAILELIETKRAEIALEAEKENYTNALGREKEAYYDYLNAVNKLNKANEKYNDLLEKNAEISKLVGTQAFRNYTYTSELTKETYKGQQAYAAIQKDLEAYNDTLKNNENSVTTYRDTWVNYKKDIIYYEDLQTAVLTEDTKKQQQLIDERTNSIIEANTNEKLTWKEKIDYAKDSADLLLKIYEENGKEITNEVRNQARAQLDEVGRGLAKQTEEVQNGKYSKELKDAWKTLASESNEAYYAAISELPDKQRKEIEKMVGVFSEKTPESEKAADKLGTNVVKKMKKDKEASKAATDTIVEYMKGMSKEDQRKLLEDCGVKNVGKVMKGLEKGDMSKKVGQQIVQGLETGLKNDYWQGRTLTAASGLSNKLLRQFKQTFGIKSPSRKTREYGIQLLRGIGVGFDKEQSTTLKRVSNFSNALLKEMSFENVDLPADASINANKMIDFNDINGSITNKTQVAFGNDFVYRISSNIAQLINNRPINVDITTKTDKGTILETAVNGINEQTKQTGVCPIKI